MFRWAEGAGLVPRGTYEHLRTITHLRPNDRRVRNVPKRTACDWNSQVKPCLPHVTPQVAAMIELQWLAGMRPGEVTRLNRASIDRDALPGVWVYRPVEHKNTHRGQELAKVLGPRAQIILAPWMLAAPSDDAPIFRPNRTSPMRRYTVEGYGRAIHRACIRAGVAPWTAYQLRYDAQRRAEAEGGIAAASAILGHRSLETTHGYAERVNLKLAAEVARKIG